jgi:uncharacterized protein DUF6551
MSAPQDPRVTYEMVERKVGDLWVDPNVQRVLKKARVGKMAADFQPDAVGVLTTSFRSARRIHVIDGQHRYRAAEAARYTGALQTMEYHGLTVPEEAALFRLLNTTEKVSRIDQFLIACVEQDPAAVRLAGYLRDHGWAVGTSATESRLSAIGSLERVFALSPEAADSTLAVLTLAYGHRPAAVQGALIEGLGRMLAKYGRDVELEDLAARLAKIPGGPDGLVGNARGQQLTRTGNLSTQVARVIVNLYNQRRRTTCLPEWS